MPCQCRVPYLRGVPREPKSFKIKAVVVQRHERTGIIRTGPDTAVPKRFVAVVALERPLLTVRMDVLVDQAGTRPRLVELHLQTDIRASITTSTLRQVLIDQLLQAVMEEATLRVVAQPEVHPHAFGVVGEPENQGWVSPPPRPHGRGHNTPDDQVREAARIYSEAVTRGSRAPGVAVAEAMGYSRAQVARYIRRARELGLLPPLARSTQQEGGKEGEPE